MKTIQTTAAIFLATFAAAGAFAQTTSGSASAGAQSPSAAASTSISAPLTEGEVRKIDKEQGKITLRHGPIVNLDMVAMTMVFRVKDPAVLDRFKAGDKVLFAAKRAQGAIVLTHIEAAK